MEASEPDGYSRIIGSFGELIKVTQVSSELLAVLMEGRMLSQSDAHRIVAKDTPEDRAMELYTTLFKKTGGFSGLCRALEQTSPNSGALAVLKRGDNDKNCASDSSTNKRRKLDERGDLLVDSDTARRKRLKYVTPPVGILEFLETSVQNALVLTTRDASLTIEKITTLTKEPTTVWKLTAKEILAGMCPPPNQSTHLLIAHCKSNISKVLSKVRNFHLKTVLVTETLSHTERIEISLFPDVIISADAFAWSDLSPAAQSEVLSKELCGEMTLAKLISLGKGAGLSSEEDILTEELLLPLIRGNVPNLFEHLLPAPIDYYLPRRILPRHSLSRRIFDEDRTSKSVFVFTFPKTMDPASKRIEELNKLVKHQRMCTSTRQLQQRSLSARYLTLDLKTDFEKVCSRTRDPVHWVHFNGSSFTWIKSQGNMEDVQNAVDISPESSTQSFYEDEFIHYVESQNEMTSKFSTPVCISDSPGMGKSILLAQLARKLAKKYPTRLVVFVAMSQLISVLKEVSKTRKLCNSVMVKALIFLASWKTESSTRSLPIIQEIVLKDVLENGNNDKLKVELCLDGFDELLVDDFQLGLEFLKFVSTQLSDSVRPWVTTRTHLMEELESCLQVLGHNIIPFDAEDQQLFLTTFWSTVTVPPEIELNDERLKQFAGECLAKLKLKMKDKEKEFAGIPLQCLLIAQVFQEDAQNYAKVGNLMSAEDILKNYEYSLIGLYQETVQTKLKIMKTTRKQYRELDDANLVNIFVYLSICLIFPDWATHFQKKLQIDDCCPSSSAIIEAGVAAGILESKSIISIRNLSFVHRTFAEYFIATYVTDSLVQGQEMCGDGDLDLSFLSQAVFSWMEWDKKSPRLRHLEIFSGVVCVYSETFVHQVICYFINELLLETSEEESENPIINVRIAASGNSGRMTLLQKKRIVRCCVRDSFLHILNSFEKVFCNSKDDDDTTDMRKWIWDRRLLYSAVFWSSEPLIQAVCFNFELLQGKRVRDVSVTGITGCMITLLHVAVVFRNYSIVETLVSCHGFRELISEFHPQIRDLIPFSCWNSRFSSPCEGESRKEESTIKMLRLLVGLNKRLVEETEHVLVSPGMCVELQIELMQQYGADPLAELDGFTILTTRTWRDGDEYGRLIEAIPREQLAQLMKIKSPSDDDGDGDSPLLLAIEASADEKTFELLRDAGADFQGLTSSGNTILEHAVKVGATLECVKALVKLGSDWKQNNAGGESLLHFAAKAGQVSSIAYFVLELGLDINALDENGNTPLESALEEMTKIPDHEKPNRLKGCLSAILEISKLGGKLSSSACSCSGPKYLNEAIKIGDVYDNNNYNPCSIIISRFPEWVKKVEEECGCSNEASKNPFVTLLVDMETSYSFILDAAQLLLESGLDINSKVKRTDAGEYYTPLELALLRPNPPYSCSTSFGAAHFSLWRQHGGVESPEALNGLMKWLLTTSSAVELSWPEFRDAVRKVEQKLPHFDCKQTDKSGNSLLHRAVGGGNCHGAKYLLKNGVNMINSRNGQGQTPLFWVTGSGGGVFLSDERSLANATLLFEHGADPTVQDAEGRWAHEAFGTNYQFSTVTLLVRKLFEKMKDDDPATTASLLHFSLTKGGLDTIKWFCSAYTTTTTTRTGIKKLSDISLKAFGHKTILHCLAARECYTFRISPEMVDFLLGLEDVRTSLFSPEASDLVHACLAVPDDDSFWRSPDYCHPLLEGILRVNKELANSRDEQGRVPLFVARAEHHQHLHTLIEHGAEMGWRDEVGSCFIHRVSTGLNGVSFGEFLRGLKEASLRRVLLLRDQLGRTLLHTALLDNQDGGGGGGEVSEDTLQLLKDHDFDFNSVDENNETALFYVNENINKYNKNIETTFRLLLEFGVDPSLPNSKGVTVLHLAAEQNARDRVNLLLISEGVEVNAVDNEGNTPLHYFHRKRQELASSGPTTERCLLDAGADPTATNKAGLTPEQLKKTSLIQETD